MNHPQSAQTPALPPHHRRSAEDLRLLAWLHASEHPADTLCQLHQGGFPNGLDLPPSPAAERLHALLAALAALPPAERLQQQEELAADYAAIYLNHTLRASPHQSVWLDEDNLMLQAPTFAVRAYYRRYGIRADWRKMADDHLSNELTFVALMLEQHHPEAALGFLRQHLLAWLPAFAERVSQRAATAFYAALAELTLHLCQTLADRLTAEGIPPVTVEPPPDELPHFPHTCGEA